MILVTMEHLARGTCRERAHLQQRACHARTRPKWAGRHASSMSVTCLGDRGKWNPRCRCVDIRSGGETGWLGAVAAPRRCRSL